MSYRLLVLDSNARYMSLPVLQKIRDLVKAGATITGVKPTGTPGLQDDQALFKNIVNEIWGNNNPQVFTGKTLPEALAAINLKPDFSYIISDEGSAIKKSGIRHQTSDILYVHRKLPDTDIYWLNNRNNSVEDIQATFSIEGKTPEIWHPETGKTEPASYTIVNGVTTVDLRLQPNDAVFVVFKEKATTVSHRLPPATEQLLDSITGEWNINFQAGRGAPGSIKIDELTSWSDHADIGIKYFSGTGIYTKTINASADWFKHGGSFWLDLGEVNNIAEVMVNGKSVGIVGKLLPGHLRDL